jgi:hypothetical protein
MNDENYAFEYVILPVLRVFFQYMVHKYSSTPTYQSLQYTGVFSMRNKSIVWRRICHGPARACKNSMLA